jgi:hypothetical protein
VKEASSWLQGIDFSKSVVVCNHLPDKLYVQFVGKHLGAWFTDTGMTPDQIGLANRRNGPRLFRPAGSVAALESTASSIKDWWSAGRAPDSVVPRAGQDRSGAPRKGQMTRGGGKQYLVINKFQMQQV